MGVIRTSQFSIQYNSNINYSELSLRMSVSDVYLEAEASSRGSKSAASASPRVLKPRLGLNML